MKIISLIKNTMDKINLNFSILVFALIALTAASIAFAQDTDSTDENMRILQAKIAADKKLLVAENMNLTDGETKNFWLIYDAYQKDLQEIDNRLAKLINEYAIVYNANTVTNEKARQLLDESIKVELAEIQLKQSYIPKIATALSGVKTVRYIQIENKIRALTRYEISEMIPLMVEGKAY
ncbi:hypothetical protein [Nitrosomonas ureae]|uniref:OmpH family outer membrane protein n=1 Tax=Nitrosomonas ureae TaxID=44577 RepID=A0A1H5ULZ0_9PROT|nr:hypothetical protein [Nitrosomonas ureae]SEF75411.1 hypothetical protein SAMN05216334_10842 [Nitrosomonas ureae]